MSLPNSLHRPYPEPGYLGEGGETSARLRRDDAPRRRSWCADVG
ncbi:MAG: hypothetical protein ACRCSN_13450 [Dermatophilaceae bacterium]